MNIELNSCSEFVSYLDTISRTVIYGLVDRTERFAPVKSKPIGKFKLRPFKEIDTRTDRTATPERFLHFHNAFQPAFSFHARRLWTPTMDDGMPMMSDIARSSEKSFEFPAPVSLAALRYRRAERSNLRYSESPHGEPGSWNNLARAISRWFQCFSGTMYVAGPSNWLWFIFPTSFAAVYSTDVPDVFQRNSVIGNEPRKLRQLSHEYGYNVRFSCPIRHKSIFSVRSSWSDTLALRVLTRLLKFARVNH